MRTILPITLAIASITIWLVLSGSAYAQPPASTPKGRTVEFQEFWTRIKDASPTRRAAEFELEAAETARGRAGRHWFPRLYGGGRVFRTNDPAASFFSTLEQRELRMTDFAPDSLNQPEAKTYQSATLGLDLPLFEGGMRVSAHSAASSVAEGRKLEGKSKLMNLYTQSAKLYGELQIYQRNERELRELLQAVNGVLERYKVGGESNPVGYSGLLGLRSMKNRIEGMLRENDAKLTANARALEELASSQGARSGLASDWQAREEEIIRYANRQLPLATPASEQAPSSLKVQGLEQMAEAAHAAAKAERARFLPRVGLFAETSLNAGDRGSATSYVGGAYLQWELFNATNLGAIGEAKARAAAADAHVDELRQYERIETSGSAKAASALEANIGFMEDSSKLLDEQTRMARKLFQSGAMNALQLTEVFNRRADLLSNLTGAKAQYLAVRATLANNLSKDISTGDTNE